MIRLDKLLSNMGAGSRKETAKYIRSGKVTVDGKIVSSPDAKVSESAEITLNNEKIVYKKHFYIMMNKPQGYVCATNDNLHKTVIDLLSEDIFKKKAAPAGRLDIDTEGFVFLTDDGDINHKITGPKTHVRKRYYIKTESVISDKQIKQLEQGVLLDDGYITKPCILERIAEQSCYMDLYEGKFHQVKRMLAAVSNKVIYLKRIYIGSLKLDESLKPGQYREITEEELKLLWT